MAYVEIDGTRIRIDAEFREKERIKSVPGSRWSTKDRMWTVPLSWASCMALRGVFGLDLQVGPGLSVWSHNERSTRVQPALDSRVAEDALGNPLLYGFQRAGVQFLKDAGSALLADEMGTGKTVQAIQAVVELEDSWPLLVVCPNSMKETWARELKKWVPHDINVFVVQGGAAGRRNLIEVAQTDYEAGYEATAVIINWEGLRGHTRLAGYGSIRLTDEEKTDRELNAIPWGTVIADEAHRAKDPSSKQTRALWGVSKIARHRYALTGTPVANTPQDLWSVMHGVAADEWPSRTAFIERYCLSSWGYGGHIDVIGLKSETRDELFSFLDPRFLRRPKEAVLPQLPPKTYQTRYVELGQKQRRAYNQLRKELLVELESGVLLAANPLTRLVRLLQFASAYGELDEAGNLLLTEPSAKVDAAVEIADELGSKQAIWFAYSRQLIDLLATRFTKLGYRYGLITGSVDTVTRQQSVELFQAGEAQFMLATLGAGGEGLTLTAADTTVFLQRSFSLIQNQQAEDRNHRIGQDRAVEVIDLVASDTAEEHVHEVMREKGEKLEEVARDVDTVRRWLEK